MKKNFNAARRIHQIPYYEIVKMQGTITICMFARFAFTTVKTCLET